MRSNRDYVYLRGSSGAVHAMGRNYYRRCVRPGHAIEHVIENKEMSGLRACPDPAGLSHGDVIEEEVSPPVTCLLCLARGRT